MSSSSFTMSLLSLNCLYRSPLLALLPLPCPLLSCPLLRLPSSLPAMLSPSCHYCPTCPAYVTHTWGQPHWRARASPPPPKSGLGGQCRVFWPPRPVRRPEGARRPLGAWGGRRGGQVWVLSGQRSSAGPPLPHFTGLWPPTKPHLTQAHFEFTGWPGGRREQQLLLPTPAHSARNKLEWVRACTAQPDQAGRGKVGAPRASKSAEERDWRLPTLRSHLACLRTSYLSPTCALGHAASAAESPRVQIGTCFFVSPPMPSLTCNLVAATTQSFGKQMLGYCGEARKCANIVPNLATCEKCTGTKVNDRSPHHALVYTLKVHPLTNLTEYE